MLHMAILFRTSQSSASPTTVTIYQIGVNDLLTPLPMAGLEDCPNLEEISIKVKGDCKGKPKPSERKFGLSILACYPKLTKMQLDCGDTRGYALTASSGQMDLSLPERYFLNGIGTLSL
ncbi:hypothetical protein RIF29_39627 [Crotalaria pallida]|uniref:Uncharacterized protein n=1 Tax=Crotalaria pallida TaxID=3830 RepID=A0AAN9HMN4_CROPI